MPKSPAQLRRQLTDELHYQQARNRLAIADLAAGRAGCRRLGKQLARLAPVTRRRR